MFYEGSFLAALIIISVIRDVNSVKIINLKVPTTYTVEDRYKPEPLILDCEYEIEPHEKGFVLKWLFDNNSIYQWIPSTKGFPLGSMKSRIDTSHFSSDNNHRAISLIQPEWNMTGEYTCAVQTFESTDKKSAYLQIIVPESDFGLTTKVDQDENEVEITCKVQNIYPQPILTLLLDNNRYSQISTDINKNTNGLFFAIVKSKISRDRIESPTPITCILTLPGTNYTKRRETLFYDQGLTTTIDPRQEEISSAISRLEAEKANDEGSMLAVYWPALIFVMLIRLTVAVIS